MTVLSDSEDELHAEEGTNLLDCPIVNPVHDINLHAIF